MAVGLKKLVELPNLRARREAAGLSMRELHELSGVGVSTIHALEKSERGAHRSTAARLARALGTTVGVLAGTEREASVEGIGSEGPAGMSFGRSGLGFVVARHLADELARAAAEREAKETGRTLAEVLEEYEREYEAGFAPVLASSSLSATEAVERVRSQAYAPVGLPFEETELLAPGEGVADQFLAEKRDY